jgi:hypothetical protein
VKLAVTTTVSRSYIPLARVLMESVALHEPESHRVVLLLDGPIEDIAGAEIVTLSELFPDPDELEIQKAIYTPYEFATALKPRLMQYLLERSDAVIFLDPDMRLFQPLTSARDALQSGSGLLLTPHRITPPADENQHLDLDWVFKAYGVYNTGFVGATAAAFPFLQWWDLELRRDCLADARRMSWADQRIVDLAPAYFDVVGWWNLGERPLSRADDVWVIDDVPLVIMHYSEVRPGKTKVFSSKMPILDSEQHALVAGLEEEWIVDLIRHGYQELSGSGYQYAVSPAGRTLTLGDRRRYRERVLQSERRGERPPTVDEVLTRFRTPLYRGIDGAEHLVREMIRKAGEVKRRAR